MSKAEHSHRQNENPNSDSARGGHRPYWQRAHRTVGFWVALCLMLAAMVIYVLTEDLAWRPRRQPPQLDHHP